MLAAHDATDDDTKSKLIKKSVAGDTLIDNCAIYFVNTNETAVFDTSK